MNAKCTANIKALKLYNRVGIQSVVEDASPHRLIGMLLDGALSRISKARSNIRKNEIEEKGTNISMAISIIGGLRDSLDHEAGGEIAENLDSLYEYMTLRLVEANAGNDPELLEEVSRLLDEIRSAWEGIQHFEHAQPADRPAELAQKTG
ncbi:MAG: flagellar export chaperone FliS [Gammaproteobacteria bacterium]|nr:flagellar export chaperone FliS [Gammaproteobacteria bacterium]